jgi:hypothetical protein
MDNNTLEKMEIVFEIEANFSACTVQWVELEKGRGGVGGGRNGGGG